MPTETGDNGFKREINSAEHPERTINYKALVQHNDNTRELGRLILQSLNIHKPDYQKATTYESVETSLQGSGIDKEVKDALQDFKILA